MSPTSPKPTTPPTSSLLQTRPLTTSPTHTTTHTSPKQTTSHTSLLQNKSPTPPTHDTDVASGFIGDVVKSSSLSGAKKGPLRTSLMSEFFPPETKTSQTIQPPEPDVSDSNDTASVHVKLDGLYKLMNGLYERIEQKIEQKSQYEEKLSKLVKEIPDVTAISASENLEDIMSSVKSLSLEKFGEHCLLTCTLCREYVICTRGTDLSAI